MSDLYVYLMRSRNKDNKDILNFKERAKTILEYRQNEDKVIAEFKDFASKGLQGEQTRLYRSVNSRNEERIREELMIRLIRDKPSITGLNRVLASVAQQVSNRDENKWLFDFDIDDRELVANFLSDINHFSGIKLIDINCHKTPNGFAVIVPHGFDTRELMEKWKDCEITLHKDRLLFLNMITNSK